MYIYMASRNEDRSCQLREADALLVLRSAGMVWLGFLDGG